MNRELDPFARFAHTVGNLQAALEGITVPFGDGIKLRFDTAPREGKFLLAPLGAKWWYCERAMPAVWFPQQFLDMGRKNRAQAIFQRKKALERGEIGPDEPDWSFFGPWFIDPGPEGDRVKLDAVNGTWIWMTTGRFKVEDDRLYCMGQWPD